MVVASPIPNADTLGAMFDRRFHIQVLQMHLLVGNDHVHVVQASQAVVSDGEQAVGVGGQVDSDDVGTLVDHNVEKPRILVREAVVILPPDQCR